jgi:hypothetical protein
MGDAADDLFDLVIIQERQYQSHIDDGPCEPYCHFCAQEESEESDLEE